MEFIIYGGYPYYRKGDKIYPCEISATGITVDFDTPLDIVAPISCVYSNTEILHPFGIKKVESWDGRKNKMVTKSNKSVESTKETYAGRTE